MSRFQLSLNVDNVDASVEFYSKLLNVAPAKHRDGYANFVVEDPPLKLVIIEDGGQPGSINHVGIEFDDGERVKAETARITAAGLPVVVDETHTCCFATQDKSWTQDGNGVPWEFYTVVADTEDFGTNPHSGTALDALLPPVDAAELQAALEDPSVLVIDAQGDGQYEAAHLPGAVDFSLDDVLTQAEAQIDDADRRVILYCTDSSCLGAEFVGTQLVDAGYTNVGRFPGGVDEWAKAGHVVESTLPAGS